MIKKILPIILVISVFALLALPVGASHSVGYEGEDDINITAPFIQADFVLNGSYNSFSEQLPTVYPALTTSGDIYQSSIFATGVRTYTFKNPFSYNPTSVTVTFPSVVITDSGVSAFSSPSFDALNLWGYEYTYWIFDSNGKLLQTADVGGSTSSTTVYSLPDDVPDDVRLNAHKIIYSDIVFTAFNPSITGADFTVVVPYAPSAQVQDVQLATPSNTIIVRDVADVGDVGDFLFNSVSGFFSFEIMPGISLYTLLLAIAGATITLWILKLVAGG